MPPRRRMMGYGTAPIPKPQRSGFPLPPPPDGKPPVRLALGQQPAPEQAPTEDMTGESDEQMMQLMRLLQGGPRG
jgi:hypothetical protein